MTLALVIRIEDVESVEPKIYSVNDCGLRSEEVIRVSDGSSSGLSAFVRIAHDIKLWAVRIRECAGVRVYSNVLIHGYETDDVGNGIEVKSDSCAGQRAEREPTGGADRGGGSGRFIQFVEPAVRGHCIERPVLPTIVHPDDCFAAR